MTKRKVKPKQKEITTNNTKKKLRDAQETQRFSIVLAVVTLILVFFLYLIFVGK